MIDADRLILKPLTYGQLVKYTKCDNFWKKNLIRMKLQEQFHMN